MSAAVSRTERGAWQRLAIVDGPTLRRRLIATGTVVPLETRPTLRLDAAGRAAAAAHAAEYLRDPVAMAWQPFHPTPPPGDWSFLPDED